MSWLLIVGDFSGHNPSNRPLIRSCQIIEADHHSKWYSKRYSNGEMRDDRIRKFELYTYAGALRLRSSHDTLDFAHYQLGGWWD